jgi:LmbE family N-acetylglucosaminyl deacetylase
MEDQENTKISLRDRLNGLRGKNWREIVMTPAFAKSYALLTVLILLGTTLFWSIASANLQLSNADQLVNPYLFQNSAAFHNALFPAAHSFLIKWPIFLLIKVFGSSGTAFTVFTVSTVVATVGGLAFILYRIERRPLFFGTLCLALASALLLVPAQPYAGGLLPVNMAMVATRNLEYLLYLASLVLFIRSPSLKNWRFWLGVGCLGLLIASDRLFLTLGLGGALLALVVYALTHRWKLVSLSVNWLLGTAAAGAVSVIVLGLIQAGKVTHVTGGGGAGPYGLAQSAHGVVTGAVYAVMGIFTNFGANPAYDATVVRNIPHQLYSRIFGLGGLSFIINIALLAFGAHAVWSLMRPTLKLNKSKEKLLDTPSKLAATLIWTTLAAIGVFIAANHYYAVDARYLTIALFAVFVAAAVSIRKRKWQPEKIVLAGAIITVGILLGLFAAGRTFSDDKAALSDINERNSLVAQVLARHPVKVLAGDYWRVLPIKYASGNSLNVMPLSGCTQARDVLSSTSWQPNLNKNSFAYLLSFDKSLTDYPQCTLKQVTTAYGRPNASTVISGTLIHPKELLLFYDHGIRLSAPKSAPLPQGPATVVPISPDQLPNTSCAGPTVLNIVAHQDDDLLFMNPDTLHDIKAGHCVRTVYVTAGDDGAGKFYWLSREQGSEAAYSNMLGTNDIWIQRIVKLNSHEFVTIANPRDNNKVSLVFMHLPDGNLKGDGFSSSHNESLAKLEGGKINLMHAADDQSTYTSSQLTAALTTFMHIYQPTEIRTQANFVSSVYPDHSDHLTVGQYTKKAYTDYEKQQYEDLVTVPLQFYIGYPVHQMPANVSDGDLQAKEAAFLAYAKFDGSVCHSSQQCRQTPTYGAYLTRQYKNDK